MSNELQQMPHEQGSLTPRPIGKPKPKPKLIKINKADNPTGWLAKEKEMQPVIVKSKKKPKPIDFDKLLTAPRWNGGNNIYYYLAAAALLLIILMKKRKK